MNDESGQLGLRSSNWGNANHASPKADIQDVTRRINSAVRGTVQPKDLVLEMHWETASLLSGSRDPIAAYYKRRGLIPPHWFPQRQRSPKVRKTTKRGRFPIVDPRELATLTAKLHAEGVIALDPNAPNGERLVKLTHGQAAHHARAALEQNATQFGTVEVRQQIGQRLSRYSFDRVYARTLKRNVRQLRGVVTGPDGVDTKTRAAKPADPKKSGITTGRDCREQAFIESIDRGMRAVATRRRSA